MLTDKTFDRLSRIKKTPLPIFLCLLLCSVFTATPVYGAKVYHCLQANGTKGYQGRPCEKDKKTVAITEQKNRKASPKKQKDDLSIIGKWTLNGIASSPEGEIQTQKEEISWTFNTDGKVTYQYEDATVVYDYTTEGAKISMEGSSIGSFEIIKSEGSSAVWKTGTTYYFLTLSSII